MPPISSDTKLIILIILIVLVPAFVCKYWWYLGQCKWGALVSYTGTLLNVIVVAANHGQMPVLGYSYIPSGLLWKVADRNSHLLWLADRFYCSWGEYSIGDAVLYSGAAAFVVLIVWEFVAEPLLRRLHG